MKTLLAVGLLCLIATPALAQLVPYWIADAGCVKHLEAEFPHTIESLPGLSTFEIYTDADVEIRRDYGFDDEGDVVWSGTATTWGGAWWDETYEHFGPPLKILDYPLTTGKTWTCEATRSVNGVVQGLCIDPQLTGTVVGPRSVATGLGTLDVIEVAIDIHYNHCDDVHYTFLLHDQLGDVTDLVDLTGCSIVPTQDLSWGSLKSIYR